MRNSTRLLLGVLALFIILALATVPSSAQAPTKCVTVEQWMERSAESSGAWFEYEDFTDDAEFIEGYVATTPMKGAKYVDRIMFIHLVTVAEAAFPKFAIMATDVKGCGLGWFPVLMNAPPLVDLILHLAEREDVQ